MIDRFGLLPEPVKNLFRVTQLKLQAQAIGIDKLEAGIQSGRVEFAEQTQVDPMTIVQLVQTQPQIYQLAGANQLKFKQYMSDTEKRISDATQLLALLTPKETTAP